MLGASSALRNQAPRTGHSIRDAIRAQQQRTLTIVASGAAARPAGLNSRALNPGAQAGGWNWNWDNPGMVPLLLQLPY